MHEIKLFCFCKFSKICSIETTLSPKYHPISFFVKTWNLKLERTLKAIWSVQPREEIPGIVLRLSISHLIHVITQSRCPHQKSTRENAFKYIISNTTFEFI